MITEELLMNAIYDAPTDDRKHIYADLPRTEDIQLPDTQAARLEYGSDGRTLAISVTDPFGSIRHETIMDYLVKCFEGRTLPNLNKTGGAGLGLFFCFKSVDSLIVNVEPHKRTEFIGLIDIHASVKDAKRKNTSFHFFNTDNLNQYFLGRSRNSKSDTVA